MPGWTARALAHHVNLPVSTLASWISQDLITPEKRGRGRGGHTIGTGGLLELLTILDLHAAGFSMQRIKRAIENLREITGHSQPLTRFMLVVRGDDIAWEDASSFSSMTFSALAQPGQRLMVFPVGDQHAELARQLNEESTKSLSTNSKNQQNSVSRIAKKESREYAL